MSEEKTESCKKYERSWMRRYWRPAMAWQYFAVCLFDFLLAPLAFGYVQKGAATIVQWTPLTLQGAGLYHLSMMAIVGAYAWGRSQEKIEQWRYNNSGGYGGYFGGNYNYPTYTPNQYPIQDGLSSNQDDDIIPPSPHTR